jgi:TolA-binding protein
MRRALALASALCLTGCAGVLGSSEAPRSSATAAQVRLLQRADDQMAAAQYRGAIALYDEFLKAYPADQAAPRARASRAVVDRLLLSQGEIERFRREIDSRQGEIERLRREVDTRQAEIDRLKADLERLRRIDLRQAPAIR